MSENNEEKAQNERIRNGLRKMIKSFDNYIKEASDFEQLEDNLKHMEETDENFHRYDLVELIRDKIETNLGDSIERNVNDAFANMKFDGDIDLQNRVAQKICQDIIKTKEVAEFKASLKQNILKANDFLTKNFYANFIENNTEEATLDNENKSLTLTYDFDFSSPDNSMNHNSFVFFTSEQFPQIARNLDPNKSDQLRLRAIQQLLAIPASDPQAADHWVDIRKYLNYAFTDPNEQIAELCLKLHSRTLASSHYKVSIEIYKNLIEHLSEYFQDKKLENRMFKSNINMLSTDNEFMLKLFRLINDNQKDVSLKWARYPDTFIEIIIDETLKFLSLGSHIKFGSLVTPVHYLALLDIQANWFSKWMHGHESRKVLLTSIKKHQTFIHAAILSLISFSANNSKKPEVTNSSRSERKKSISSMASSVIAKRTIYKKSEIEYAHFVHSLNIIKKILCFKNGRQLFPVKIENKEVNIKDLIKIVIQLIFDTASSKTSNEFSPSKYAYELLQDLCIAEDTCDACLCNEEIIDQLLKPIKSIIQNKKLSQPSSSNLNSSLSPVYDESCLLKIANVLSKLASTEHGYKQLLFNNSKLNLSFDKNKNSAGHVIATFVRKALENQLSHPISNSEISEYIYLIRLLYSQCQGEFLIREYGLNKLITESWKSSASDKSISNTPRQQENTDFPVLTWSDSLLDNLLNMASTPKGVFYLNETELLNQVTIYLFKRYKSKLQVGKYEKFGYGFLISQLANTPSGCYYLNEAQLIQSLIDEIWIELEFGMDDFMSAFPRAYSVESIDREVYKPMLCLVNILSSFSCVYEFLADVTATPRSFYGSRDLPKGLVSLLDRVTFLDKKSKISSLSNFEQSHIFGLKFVSILQCDLDILLLLETQFNLTSILLYLQKSNRSVPCSLQPNDNDIDTSRDDDYDEEEEDNYGKLENVEDGTEKKEIIIDALSVERNFVLVNSNLIGGPSEKVLPVKNFQDARTFSYEFPLFDKLPIPSLYIKKPDYSHLKKSEEFEDFIKSFSYDQIIKNEESQLNWRSKFQNLYLKSLKESKLNIDLMSTALNQLVKILLKLTNKTLISSIEVKTDFDEFSNTVKDKQLEMSQIQKLGIDKTIQYGTQINQLVRSTKEESKNKLTELHKFIKNLLKISNSNSKKSYVKQESYLAYCQEEFYPGYD
ncbi:unnamed protein product, partial [Brachionus calyciflorus]